MNDWLIGIIAIAGTLLVYAGALYFHRRFPHPFTFPLLIGTIMMVVFFLLTGISYETYRVGGQWLEWLLGPAVVALAYPLYKQRHLLKKYFLSLLGSVLVGTGVGLSTAYVLASVTGVDKELIYSLLPQSITTPVAMEVSASIGGSPAITAIFVMIAGIGGAVAGPAWFRFLRIRHPVSRGIGTGTASHAIGTARSLQNSEEEGAASSVAMTVSAIVVSILIPILVVWLLH